MSEWINIKDKQPDHETFVLSCSKGYLPRVSLFHLSEKDYLFLNPDCMREQIIGVTHWMPLPKPPQLANTNVITLRDQT
jgi:hypothetical protein